MVKSKSSRKSSKKKSFTIKRIPGKCCDASMHSLNKWYDEMFEKLGWMVLAKSRGMTDKINTYMNSIYRLKMALEQKINKVHEVDRKNDLEIMLHNVIILLAHAKHDF